MNASAIIAANIAAHTVDGQTAQHMVADAHARTIRGLCAEVIRLTGDGLTSKPGRHLSRVTFLDSACWVEWEYDDDTGMTFTGVFINGVMSSAAKLPDEITEAWEDEIRRDAEQLAWERKTA